MGTPGAISSVLGTSNREQVSRLKETCPAGRRLKSKTS